MKDITKKQILKRMQRYCALEDRSTQKIREKLNHLKDLNHRDKEEILSGLATDGFLDDARFTETYIRSKINQNKWGRQKIRNGLIRHRIPEDMIDRGLDNMNRSAYYKNLKILLASRQKTTDDTTVWMRYLLQKGYDYDEILEVIGT